MFDYTTLKYYIKLIFLIKDLSLTIEGKAFFASNFSDGAAGGEITIEDLEVASVFNKIRDRADNSLVLGKRQERYNIFGKGFAGYSRDITVLERY